MKKIIITVSAFALLMVFITGDVFAATAVVSQSPTFKHEVSKTIQNVFQRIVVGKVTTIAGTTMTLTTNGKTPKIYTIDISTAVVKKEDATIKATDLAIGDTVFAHATAVISGTAFVADSITDGLQNFSKGKFQTNKSEVKNSITFGKVSAVDGNTISVESNKGKNTETVTVTVDEQTKYIMSGVKNPNLTAVTVGSFAMVAIRNGVTTVHIMPVAQSKGIRNHIVKSKIDKVISTPVVTATSAPDVIAPTQ